MKKQILDAYEHGEYPLEELLEKLELERDLSRNPLFDTVFAYQPLEQQEFSTSDLKVTPYEQPWKTAKFDMTWTVVEEPERIGISIEYSTALWNQATIERMTQHFTWLLEQIAEQPEI